MKKRSAIVKRNILVRVPIHSSGQMIVEIVVTISVVVLLVTALIVASTVAMHNIGSAKDKSTALSYAQEGMETTRDLRNSVSWSDFQGKIGTWCLAEDKAWSVAFGGSCPGNVGDKFTRSINLSWDADLGHMNIQSTVSWEDRGTTQYTTLETYLTDWRKL
ncbi:hypothetical protein KKB64_01415 [Patescibacteria group bacterium]|nr:hypothetical protein [Patescibacteria group bacterium]MBU1472429.1 hypothetical protein [Patescibacteria group bacterium]MBU2460244.1 hypothetical protein [Patescibacteria group bacterium]MBU2544551.1 hypothetical protein [Patescibacteria group bacterium]